MSKMQCVRVIGHIISNSWDIFIIPKRCRKIHQLIEKKKQKQLIQRKNVEKQEADVVNIDIVIDKLDSKLDNLREKYSRARFDLNQNLERIGL